MTEKYKDIIQLPRPQWKSCPPMSMIDRGAQFAPFAALAGYESMIEEMQRGTENRCELSEDVKEELDKTILELSKCVCKKPKIRIRYYEEDLLKNGGMIRETEGILETLVLKTGQLRFQDGRIFWACDILAIDLVG